MPHLPQVPEKFIELAREVSGLILTQPAGSFNASVTQSYLNRHIICNGKSMPTRIQQYCAMGQEWAQWCKDNIFANFHDTSARISTGSSDTHGAHRDQEGKIRLYYLIEPGDATAETVFYMDPGKPVVQDINDPNDPDRVALDHDVLIELERVQFPLRQWVLFNGCVLHAVEKNSSPRLNLTVDIHAKDLQFSICPTLNLAK